MRAQETLNDQEIIALLESQRDTSIAYPQDLFEKRRTTFLKGVAALGVALIAWNLLGVKGVIKLSELTMLGIKALLTVATVQAIAISYIYRESIQDFLIPPTPVSAPLQIQPYQHPTPAATLGASPYPSPAPSITPEPTLTAVARSASATPVVLQQSDATATNDGPPYSYGLTKTPKPGDGQDNDNNQGNHTDSEKDK